MRRQQRGTHRYAQVWHVHRPSLSLSDLYMTAGRAATFRMGALVEGHGGERLHRMVLSDGMFAASEMAAGGDVDFEAMKVVQLKAELAERGSTRTGLKAVLQRRLHALIVQAAQELQASEMDES